MHETTHGPFLGSVYLVAAVYTSLYMDSLVLLAILWSTAWFASWNWDKQGDPQADLVIRKSPRSFCLHSKVSPIFYTPLIASYI